MSTDSDEEAGAAPSAREVDSSFEESTPVFERQISHVATSLKKTRNALCKFHNGVPEVVPLNVGGQVFSASRAILEKDPQSLLFILVSQCYIAHETPRKPRMPKRAKTEEVKKLTSVEIPERDPKIFVMLLNMLRGYVNAIPSEWKEACWKEAVYYGLTASWYERYGNRRPYAFQLLTCKRKLLSEAVYGVASEYFTAGEHYIDFGVVKWDRVALGVISSDADIESREDPLDTFGCAFYWNDGRISSFFSSLAMFNSGVALTEGRVVRVILDASENTVKWMWDDVTTIAMLRLPRDKTFAFCADKTSFLGGVKKSIYQCARRPHPGGAKALNAGTIDAYVERHKETPASPRCRAALFNKVKVCPTCGKPNGYTMGTCNQCQCNLSAVALSTTPNLFSAFLLSIAEGPKFPLKVSMRTETPDVMVFDDPLALSPLHFCAIPTSIFIPDWRYLTLHPQRGLQVCQLLVDSCHAAAKEQFLANEAFCASVLREKDFDAATQMLMGFNFPPSQNQIHVQYMLPVLMPHQYMLFLRGVHYTAQRFFPVSYVQACLVELVKKGTSFAKADLDLDIGIFIARLDAACGIHYDHVHAQFIKDVERLHGRYAKWDKDSFAGTYKVVEGAKGKLAFTNAADGKETIVDEHQAYEGEKAILQNYGKDGFETGSFGFYSFSKSIDDLDFSFIE